jgi:[acyl-carrier-protein] S-malonyltransferase
MLDRASVLCGNVLGHPVDLAARVEAREPSSLDTFVHDVATIVAMELAQVRLLEEFFAVDVHSARLSLGHSIGELSAVVLGGVYEMEQLLPVPLGLAKDCAELTIGTSIGILSTRDVPIDVDDLQHLCNSISSRGHGMVGPSTFLSPFQILLLGEGDTLDIFEHEMREHLPKGVTLRKKPNPWPPLHTPLVWQRNIPNRTAVAMLRVGGGEVSPRPHIISCSTGSDSYDRWNSRGLLTDWTDHPQRLWDAIENTLSSGVDLIIHVGPEPKLLPSIFDRLSARIMKQLKSRHLGGVLGSTVIPSISRNPWITRKLPGHAALLRAPFVRHIILEDWLLASDISRTARVRLTEVAPTTVGKAVDEPPADNALVAGTGTNLL